MKMKKIVSLFCTAALVVSAASVPVGTAYALDVAADAPIAVSGEPENEKINVSTLDVLLSYLKSDGDCDLRLAADLNVMLSHQTGVIINVGKGKKVLDLSGHFIEVRDDSDESDSAALFNIGEGASLVLNDSSVTYPDGSPYIEAGYIRFYNYSAGGQSNYFSQRDLFILDGGSLTVNSGTYVAGHAEEIRSYYMDEYLGMAVTHGTALTYNGGKFTMNGGTIVGYGGKGELGDSFLSTHTLKSYTRNSVIQLKAFEKYAININGGNIIAMAGANAFDLCLPNPGYNAGEDEFWDSDFFTVRGCTIDLDYFDRITVLQEGPRLDATFHYISPGPGRVCLSAELPENTEVYMGIDNVTEQKSTRFYSTSDLAIMPKEEIGKIIVYGIDGSGGMWDKLSSHTYQLHVPDNYFPALTKDDIVRSDSVILKCSLLNSEGKSLKDFNLSPAALEGAGWTVDLNAVLPKEVKDKLEVGETYYFAIEKIEQRITGTNNYVIHSKNASEPGTPILITEPDPIKEAECTVQIPQPGDYPVGDPSIPMGVKYFIGIDGWFTDEACENMLYGSVPFEADKDYCLKVRFYAKEGYDFDDSAQFRVNGVKAAVVDKGEETINERPYKYVDCKAKFSTKRDAVYVAGCTVTPPSVGAHPKLTAKSDDESEYTVESVTVFEKEYPYTELDETSIYEPDKEYVVRVKLKAAKDLRFTSDTVFNINNVSAVKSGGSADVAVIDRTFKTGKEHLDTAYVTTDKKVIQEGDKAYAPEFISNEPADYEVTFRNWLDYTTSEKESDMYFMFDGASFTTGSVYYLNVTLKPKSDKYVIDTHTALNINGEEAKFAYYDSAKQEYYYSLPMTCKKPIYHAYCTITEPADGAYPVFSGETAEPELYSVSNVRYVLRSGSKDISLGADSQFKTGNKYIVYVEFAPTDGCMFTDDTIYYINGVEAKKYYDQCYRQFFVGDCEHSTTHWERLEPTCSHEGHIEYWSCNNCGKLYEDEACTKEVKGSVVLAKKAHTPAAPVKENETQFTYESVIYCAVCGEELSREWVATSGHDHVHTPGEQHKENETAPTCALEGGYDLIIRCTECEDIVSIKHVVTEKIPHTPGKVKKENETTEGYDKAVYCDVCGEELSREYVDKSTLPTDAIYGDVDKDGVISATDALMILRVSAGLDTFDDEQKKIADVDLDGEIMSSDSLAVLRYSVGLVDKGSRVGTKIE